ncbi:MAG: replicative DNA helicase, partial [Patescibacteria group bacterium]
PHNIEAEQSLLGALLIDKEAVTKVADIVTAEDFYRGAHGILFSAMLELYENHEPIDLLSISNILQEKGSLEVVGGRSTIMGLAAIVPNASNVTHYARIIQKKAMLRRLNAAATEISELSFCADEDVQNVLDKAESRIFGVAQKLLKKLFVPIKDILSDAFERIEEVHRERGKLRGISSGFAELDNILGGLQKSDLVVLAARPSVGKTSLALDIARHAALQGKRSVAIFSLEMAKEQLVDRLICSEAGVDLWKMRTGKLSDRPDSDDFLRIGHAINALSEGKMFIDDTATANILEIKTKARRLQSEHGLDLIILDYLQLMESQSKSEGRVQEVAEITRGLKAIARELQ